MANLKGITYCRKNDLSICSDKLPCIQMYTETSNHIHPRRGAEAQPKQCSFTRHAF